MAAVSLIVHLEGGRDRARLCLEALAGLAEEPSFEAVIVDDASADLGELLAGLSGDVKVLRKPRREGFLACAVAGAEAASAEAIVLLRDAPLLDPGALGPLLEALAGPGTPAPPRHPRDPAARPGRARAPARGAGGSRHRRRRRPPERRERDRRRPPPPGLDPRARPPPLRRRLPARAARGPAGAGARRRLHGARPARPRRLGPGRARRPGP